MSARSPKPASLDLGTTPLHQATRARIAMLKRAQWRKVQDAILTDERLYSGAPEQCSAVVEAGIDAVVGPRRAVLGQA